MVSPKKIVVLLILIFFFAKKSCPNEWLLAGSLAGLGFISWHYDEDIQRYFRKNNNDVIAFTGEYVFEPITGGLAAIPVLAGTWYYGHRTENSLIASFAVDGAAAFMAARAFAYIPKYLTHRERPYEQDELNKNAWHGPSFSTGFKSFPSGHAASAFAVATVASHNFKEHKWVAPACYSLAAIASISRVYRDKHWASDIAAGAVLGILTGYAVNKLSDKMMITPYNNGPYSGVGFYYSLP